MTLTVRTTNSFCRRGGGFTLLEITVVMALAMMMVGAALGLMISSPTESALKGTSGKIEGFAKRAHMVAMLHQTPYALEFTPTKVRLLPLAELSIGHSEKREKSIHTRPPVHDEILISGMTASLRRWNASEWLPLDVKHPLVWRFDPDGLCEPLSVRLTMEKGWISQAFHPLSATAHETEMEIK